LITAGADVDRADFRGRTPLSVAAYRSHAGALVTLIDSGADVHVALAGVLAALKAQRAGKAKQRMLNAELTAEIRALSTENAALSAEIAGLREGARVDVVDMETEPLAEPVDESDAAPPRSALSAVHQANTQAHTKLKAVKRERDDKQEDFLDEQDEHHIMRAFSLRQQEKVAELVDMALAAGGDRVAVNAIRDRH
jgi:ankyrin repeat protein